MNHGARGPKKPVNMTLSEDLVREARVLTGNLSETVEQLLAEFIARERRRRDEKERQIDATIAMLNELYDRHGGLDEEFRRSEGPVRRSCQFRSEPS